jgi:hypothetical protein
MDSDDRRTIKIYSSVFKKTLITIPLPRWTPSLYGITAGVAMVLIASSCSGTPIAILFERARQNC